MSVPPGSQGQPPDSIAIIGIACRFGDVEGPEEFWRALVEGRELVSTWDGDGRPGQVRAGGALTDADAFDAHLFGISPMEATLTDPQHRVFLESCWHALEHAGHDPRRFPGDIGVFAGCGVNTYLPALESADLGWAVDDRLLSYGNEKDFLALRVSFRLGLTGPSVTVQTACSTSLTAVHLACQSLADYECDLALAGGSSVALRRRDGYSFSPEGVLSADGHCRPFDRRATGTVPSDGVAVVALRRLPDALADGDRIVAVILGSAVRNDGRRKAGFSAPSVAGQVATMRAAFAAADVDPSTVDLVEAHGTGTALGDPIELAALSEVLGRGRAHPCYLTGTKGALGHTDTAAGAAGLIAAALSLSHAAMPPIVNHAEPAPSLAVEGKGLDALGTTRPWPASAGPRRAAVNSLGVGGSNAHVVLQEAPAVQPPTASAAITVLPLSAATPAALDRVVERLRDHAVAADSGDIADLGYTLQCGRAELRYRTAVVAHDRDELVAKLDTAATVRSSTPAETGAVPRLALLFPGGGAQRAGMGEALYRDLPAFRDCLHRTASKVGRVDAELAGWIANGLAADQARSWIEHPPLALPALFLFEYALADLFARAGIMPDAMVGHSLGEYTAATLAGVFDPADAFAAIRERGLIMAQTPAGGMMSVPLGEDELLPLIADTTLDLAAVNGRAQCVVTGPRSDLQGLRDRLTVRGLESRLVPLAAAAHSRAIEPYLDRFAAFLDRLPLGRPRVPFVSNLTGAWADPDEVATASYWTRHLRAPVRFRDGLRTAVGEGASPVSMVEVGPGSTLTSLARRELDTGVVAIAACHRPAGEAAESELVLEALATLWTRHHSVRWDAVCGSEPRRRVDAPVYPFERRRFAVPATRPTGGSRRVSAAGFEVSVPGWRRLAESEQAPAGLAGEVVVVSPGGEAGDDVTGLLVAHGATVTHVRPAELSNVLAGRPAGAATVEVIDASPLSGEATYLDRVATAAQVGGIVAEHAGTVQRLTILTAGAFDVLGDENVDPTMAPYLALHSVVPAETEVRVRLVDAGGSRLERGLWLVLSGGPDHTVVALRGRHCWVPSPVSPAVPREPLPLPDSPVVLVTGGLGGVGSLLAEHLATVAGARLAVTTRGPSDASTESLRRLEAAASEVAVLACDLTEPEAALAAVRSTVERFGRIDIVIHAAAVPFGAMLETRRGDAARPTHDIKALAASGLAVALETVGAAASGAMLLLISTVPARAVIGAFDYLAANAYLDLLARRHDRSSRRVVSIAWDRWRGVGMARALEERHFELTGDRLTDGLAVADALAAFAHCLRLARVGETQLAVRGVDGVPPEVPVANDPDRSPTAAPDSTSELERLVARLWAQALGLDRIESTDNFFDLGGDSLVAMQVVRRLRTILDRTISIKSLLTHATVAEFAALLERESLAEREAVPAPAAVTRSRRVTVGQLRQETP